MLDKPADVFDRDTEWADLADFVLSPWPGLRIAVVYGRRRQGKSYLLRRLTDAVSGLYHLATEQAEPISLRRFGDSVATWAGLSAGSFGFGDWEQALRTATEVLTSRVRSEPSPGLPGLLVLDEFPYLCQENPGLPSIVQSLYDSLGPGAGADAAPLRLILCGSAISVMADLLSGTRALRGRAALELRVRPFGYRDAREYWGITTLPPPSRTTPSSAALPATGNSWPIRTFPTIQDSSAAGWRGMSCARPCRCSMRPVASCTRTRGSATPPPTARSWRPWRQGSPLRRRSAAFSAALRPRWSISSPRWPRPGSSTAAMISCWTGDP